MWYSTTASGCASRIRRTARASTILRRSAISFPDAPSRLRRSMTPIRQTIRETRLDEAHGDLIVRPNDLDLVAAETGRRERGGNGLGRAKTPTPAALV